MSKKRKKSNKKNQGSAMDMGLSTLERINYLLWVCNEASSQNQVDNWYNTVRTLYKESRTYISDEQKNKMDSYVEQAETDYNKYLQWRNQRQINDSNPPRDIFDTLYEWEMQLREALDDQELLIKKK